MKVFISYRRGDSAGHTGRLYDSLRGPIGDDKLFLDLSGIDSGQDFVAVIQTAIQSCDVLLAIIGPEWLAWTADGQRRLDDPADLVRSEIQAALGRNIPVIPVLVGGASPPPADALPTPLKALATRDAHELTDERWQYDVERLIAAMRRIAPHQRRPRRAWMLAAAASVIAIVAIAAYGWPRIGSGTLNPASPPATTVPPDAIEEPTGEPAPAPTPARVEGMWVSKVKYEWGATYTERFDFTVHGAELSGTASFLGVPRAIVAGKVEDGRLTFETHTQEIGVETREVRHQYRGRIAKDTIEFSMQSTGGTSEALAAFTAARTEPPSP